MAKRKFEGLFLVSEGSSPPAAMRVVPSSLDDVDLTFTDETTRRAHIRDALLAAITRARSKVLLASFLFSDEAIVRALCAASERLRGGVYVLTALDKHMKADRSEPDAEEDLGVERRRQRERKHEELLREMARAGVWLRSSNDAHAKLCVVDDELCAVTSANATNEAFEANPELALVLRHPGVARELGRLFARVWLHRSTFDSEPGADLNVKSRTPAKVPDWTPLTSNGDVRAVATVWSEERSLLETTLEIIEGAERELSIATYSVVAIEDHPVGVALRAAARRGVQIRLVLQPRNEREDQRNSLAWLVRGAPGKVLVRGLGRTHAKAIVADRARAGVGPHAAPRAPRLVAPAPRERDLRARRRGRLARSHDRRRRQGRAGHRRERSARRRDAPRRGGAHRHRLPRPGRSALGLARPPHQPRLPRIDDRRRGRPRPPLRARRVPVRSRHVRDRPVRRGHPAEDPRSPRGVRCQRPTIDPARRTSATPAPATPRATRSASPCACSPPRRPATSTTRSGPCSPPSAACGSITRASTSTRPSSPQARAKRSAPSASGQFFAYPSTVNNDNIWGTFVVLVFDAFTAPASPRWSHLQPIFRQYAHLYPGMKAIMDISQHSVVSTPANIAKLTTVFSHSEHDARYMPVTRDLSPAKRNMILAWLAAGAPL